MSSKSSDPTFMLHWACVPMPQGESQNYSVFCLCSTDTFLWINPQHIYYKLVFIMNIVPRKKPKQKQTCKNAWKA